MLGLFDAGLFLDDLISQRGQYCSPLLVCSILSWAAVSPPAVTVVLFLDSVVDVAL